MRKRILDRFFSTGTTTKDYAHRSLLLNIDLNESNKFCFTLSASEIIEGKSKIPFDSSFKTTIQNIIVSIIKLSIDEKLSDDDFYKQLTLIQSKLSVITDDFLPQSIREYFLVNKDLYDYLVIEDDNIDFNIPFGVLFFPKKSENQSITGRGYFLSELYTLIRSTETSESVLQLTKIRTLSSENLPGSILEERAILDFFNSKISNIAEPINSIEELEESLKNESCNLYHFCCHGGINCNIISEKKGIENEIGMDMFNLIRFPDHTFVFLNICLSNFTTYENEIPRSISNKLINRHSELVVVTEWPINDFVGFKMGTNFYTEVLEKGRTSIQAIHNIKKNITNKRNKFTAIAYSLKGNPNLRFEVINAEENC